MSFKKGDLVEAKVSFIVIRSDKHFRMKVILRYLCLEDDKPSDVSALSACMPGSRSVLQWFMCQLD